MSEQMPVRPNPKPLLLGCLLPVCLAVGGCWFFLPAKPNEPPAEYGTASQAEKDNRSKQITDLKTNGVLLKFTISTNRRSAELFVLPPFKLLNIDEKAAILRLSYFHIFQLSERVTSYPAELFVLDGINGEWIDTVDIDRRGFH